MRTLFFGITVDLVRHLLCPSAQRTALIDEVEGVHMRALFNIGLLEPEGNDGIPDSCSFGDDCFHTACQ